MIDIKLKKQGVYLGRAGETGRKRVWVDITAWEDEYGPGEGLMLYRNPEGKVIPMETVREEGTDTEGQTWVRLYGTVGETETAVAGVGNIEARLLCAGVVAKSDSFGTVVISSMDTGKNEDEKTPKWVRQLMADLKASRIYVDTVKEIENVIDGYRDAAEEEMLASEAWAKGTRNGEPVGETDPAYGNNSKKFASDSEAWAVGKRGGVNVDSDDEAYENNAKKYMMDAGGSATAALSLAKDAEAWANGTQYGQAIPNTHPAYEKNAKYWSEHAFSATPEGYEDLVDGVDDLKSAFTALDDEYHAHIVNCPNMFNPNDSDIIEDAELTTNGATASKTGYFASGYYPVIPGGTVCLHYPTETYGSASKIYLYNANKTYRDIAVSNVSRLTDPNGHTYIRYTFSASTQAKWFRVTGYMAAESYYMYVYAAEMPSTYTPFTTNKTLEDTYVDFSMVRNVEISKDDTDFINDKPVNLVDLTALVPGIVTNSNSNGDIDTSGTYGSNWVTTDYIPVEPNATYALCIFMGVNYGSGFLGVPYYDENKTYLGRIKQAGGSVPAIAYRVTITLPSRSDIKYIRTSYYKSYTDSTGSDHKRWWQCQIFKASAWPTDLYIPFDDSDKIVDTRLDDVFSGKYNPLWGKSAIWNGDSICAADSDTGAGWPGRIATANGMKYKNYGVAGGTIAENTGSGVHSISSTLDGMITDFPNADYIIIEGGTNDADILGDNGIGTYDPDDFTAGYIAALNRNTFSGALESIFYRLVTQMKTKHIGYVIPQKMGHTEILVTRRRVYFDRAIAICQKWGIPYIDLWNNLYFNWRLAAHWDQEMTNAQNEAAGNLYLDGQHLTTTGYAVEATVIEEWMKTL